VNYLVYRAAGDGEPMTQLTPQPLRRPRLADADVQTDVPYRYQVCSVSRRGVLGPATAPVEATPRVIRDPVFVARFQPEPSGQLLDGESLRGKRHGNATVADDVLDLSQGGSVTFPYDDRFQLQQPLSIECWVRFEQPGSMPVVLSCGAWNRAGWFLQRLGGHWRWHVGGIDCDGGRPVQGQWTHIVASWDGHTARLYEDGQLVAERSAAINTAPWPGDLHVGQYSGGPAAQYQTLGQLKGIRIYHRSIEASELSPPTGGTDP
jgi:hypothetical protein